MVDSRTMDVQFDWMCRLANLLQRISKEPKDRRTLEKKGLFLSQHTEIWTAITDIHKSVLPTNPPEKYLEDYNKARKDSEAILAKLEKWGKTSQSETSTEENRDGGTAGFNPLPVQQVQGADGLSSTYVEQSQKGDKSTPFSPQMNRSKESNGQECPPLDSNLKFSWQLNPPLDPNLKFIDPRKERFDRELEKIQDRYNWDYGDFRTHYTHNKNNNKREGDYWSSNKFDSGTVHRTDAKESSEPADYMQVLGKGVMAALEKLSSHEPRAPDLRIPSFSGNIREYHQFKEIFLRLKTKYKWHPLECFTQLRELCKGEAKNLIANLALNDGTFDVAMRILDRQYDNTRRLLSVNLAEIANPSFKLKFHNYDSIRSHLTTCTTVRDNIRLLQCSVEDVLVEQLLMTLDEKTRERFDDFVGFTTKTPSFETFEDFLQKECQLWQKHHSQANNGWSDRAIRGDKRVAKTFATNNHRNSAFPPSVPTQLNSENNKHCLICSQPHLVKECAQLLSSYNRRGLLRKCGICFFCLDHPYTRGQDCPMKPSTCCRICKGNHNTLLHYSHNTPTPTANPFINSTNTLLTSEGNNCSLLPTASIPTQDHLGNYFEIRSLIDNCAERSYICEHLVQKLKLKKVKDNVEICGINGLKGKAKYHAIVNVNLSRTDQRLVTVKALVVPSIVASTFSHHVPNHILELTNQLADVNMSKDGLVGMLLGSDILPHLYVAGQGIQITPDGFVLQPTHLGLIVSGGSKAPKSIVSAFVTLNESFSSMSADQELTKRIIDFYEIPDFRDSKVTGDEVCEEVYQKKHTRQKDGRYVVPIPWKTERKELGHSFRKAVALMLGQEKRWLKNPEHYRMSNEFMREYEALGHMTQISEENTDSDSSQVYYIPYLSILRKDALTTKLRNVFNASMPSSNGVSLNDTMFEGPKLQTCIKEILLACRSFEYMYSADISKMFRQILVVPEDRDMQRIVWRPSVNERPREYVLNTVTYGTDSAPFLAIRTIQQCAIDNAPSPEVRDIILKAFYVDDLLFGADSIEEAQQNIKDITTAMAKGKFTLTKWNSNDQRILKDVPKEHQIISYLSDPKTNMVKILGMPYDTETDTFQLSVKVPQSVTYTKRGISSIAASFYDPLGFILPFIMSLRICLQQVWREKVDWDEQIPEASVKQFDKCLKGIESLRNIQIPRFLPSDNNMLEFVGFSDASNYATAAVIYSRTRVFGTIEVNLVIAKGNVNKLKTPAVVNSKQHTIPKLELEAIVSLAELYEKAKKCFKHRAIRFVAFTDSKVALAWVKNNKKQENQFVERRVEKIKNIFNPSNLHYVRSEENPADPASRGLSPDELAKSSLWFSGPEWLKCDSLPNSTIEQEETRVLNTQAIEEIECFSWMSSWFVLLRVIARCLRWKYKPTTSYISGEEITRARKSVIKYIQNKNLSNEIFNLEKGRLVPKKSWTYNLSPFIDSEGVLRVGGRLSNAKSVKENQRHPIIFPNSHSLSLMIRQLHLDKGHASNSLMLRSLIEDYWIPGIKRQINTCIKKCVECTRWKAKVIQPEMGQLPSERVTPANIFENIGLDLSGPYTIKVNPLRNAKTMKIWVVNFVCMYTKAVHLEIVSSLSSEDFLAAFSRFNSRRGTCQQVMSDNGTNLVGSNRLIKETWEKICKDVAAKTAMQEISWKFIPRHSPTFGGLWEACVKSMKYFVKRMMGTTNLVYEEFYTLICQIEALLNSRPLFANPLNPEDEPALTPFHFITLRKYKPSSIDGAQKVPLTKKWLIIHQIKLDFWQRFSDEYLRELQAKRKWIKKPNSLKVDDIVIVKEPSVTPGDWRLGRVVKTYPDSQEVVRKVEVITANNDIKIHAVNQLVPLFNQDEVETLTN